MTVRLLYQRGTAFQIRGLIALVMCSEDQVLSWRNPSSVEEKTRLRKHTDIIFSRQNGRAGWLLVCIVLNWSPEDHWTCLGHGTYSCCTSSQGSRMTGCSKLFEAHRLFPSNHEDAMRALCRPYGGSGLPAVAMRVTGSLLLPELSIASTHGTSAHYREGCHLWKDGLKTRCPVGQTY